MAVIDNLPPEAECAGKCQLSSIGHLFFMNDVRKEEREALEAVYGDGEDGPVSVRFSEDTANVSLRIDVPLGRFTVTATNANGGLTFF